MARKFHLRFSLIFPLLKTILSLIPVKEKCVWVVAVKVVDLCQFTPTEGSDRLFVFNVVIWIVIKLPAGFCVHPNTARLTGGSIPGFWVVEARLGGEGGGGSQQSPRAGGAAWVGSSRVILCAKTGKGFAVMCSSAIS